MGEGESGKVGGMGRERGIPGVYWSANLANRVLCYMQRETSKMCCMYAVTVSKSEVDSKMKTPGFQVQTSREHRGEGGGTEGEREGETERKRERMILP